MTTVAIPNRPAFRAQEVCEIVDVQPYVLRSWESEFPDLGVAKTAGGARVYRRADIERVLRIKQLIFGEGLTLAGVHRLLTAEGVVAPDAPIDDSEVDGMADHQTRRHLTDVRRDLQWILGVLAGVNGAAAELARTPSSPRASAPRASIELG
ncbi:MAG: MerR family transcriptional regulator, partial [Acidobacteriota bacterium]